jgi:hypothetical protein
LKPLFYDLTFPEGLLEGMMKKQYFRCMTWFLLLWVSPSCFGQAIRVRIVNGENGHLLSKQQITVSLLYDGSEKQPVKYDAVVRHDTDANGAAQFDLPEPPPAHLSVGARLTSDYWHCGCAAPAIVVTKELMLKGIVEGMELRSPTTLVKAEPGEILFVARPFTFFERLLYPLLKE